MDAEGVEQEKVGKKRRRRIVSGKRILDEMPDEGTGCECCSLQAHPGHEHESMQRPHPAEAPQHEPAELAAIGDPLAIAVGDDKTGKNEKEIDEHVGELPGRASCC